MLPVNDARPSSVSLDLSSFNNQAEPKQTILKRIFSAFPKFRSGKSQVDGVKSDYRETEVTLLSSPSISKFSYDEGRFSVRDLSTARSDISDTPSKGTLLRNTRDSLRHTSPSQNNGTIDNIASCDQINNSKSSYDANQDELSKIKNNWRSSIKNLQMRHMSKLNNSSTALPDSVQLIDSDSDDEDHIVTEYDEYNCHLKPTPSHLNITPNNSNLTADSPPPLIPWQDIHINIDDNTTTTTTTSSSSSSGGNNVILGKGSSGIVLRAVWASKEGNIDVAIKLMTRTSIMSNVNTNNSPTSLHVKNEYIRMKNQAIIETKIMLTAKSKIKNKQKIITAYGVADGIISSDIIQYLNLLPDEEGIGIVMKYESGGSLQTVLDNKSKQRETIPILEKLKLLKQIVSGISELHSIGIIHADIKPENILLTREDVPQVRLADFGLSQLYNHEDSTCTGLQGVSPVMLSRTKRTNRTRGTLLYCAPEMLVNPYRDHTDVKSISSVAKPSRSSDMYAFGILTWQVLAQRRPFSEITTEAMLCSMIHQDYRPPLEKLPKNTPPEMIEMMTSCWDNERSKRMSASECEQVLDTLISTYTTWAYAYRLKSIEESDENRSSIDSPRSSTVSCKDDGPRSSRYRLFSTTSGGSFSQDVTASPKGTTSHKSYIANSNSTNKMQDSGGKSSMSMSANKMINDTINTLRSSTSTSSLLSLLPTTSTSTANNQVSTNNTNSVNQQLNQSPNMINSSFYESMRTMSTKSLMNMGIVSRDSADNTSEIHSTPKSTKGTTSSAMNKQNISTPVVSSSSSSSTTGYTYSGRKSYEDQNKTSSSSHNNNNNNNNNKQKSLIATKSTSSKTMPSTTVSDTNKTVVNTTPNSTTTSTTTTANIPITPHRSTMSLTIDSFLKATPIMPSPYSLLPTSSSSSNSSNHPNNDNYDFMGYEYGTYGEMNKPPKSEKRSPIITPTILPYTIYSDHSEDVITDTYNPTLNTSPSAMSAVTGNMNTSYSNNNNNNTTNSPNISPKPSFRSQSFSLSLDMFHTMLNGGSSNSSSSRSNSIGNSIHIPPNNITDLNTSIHTTKENGTTSSNSNGTNVTNNPYTRKYSYKPAALLRSSKNISLTTPAAAVTNTNNITAMNKK